MFRITSITNPPHGGSVSLAEDRSVTVPLPMSISGTCRLCRHNSISLTVDSATQLTELIADGTYAGRIPTCRPCLDAGKGGQ